MRENDDDAGHFFFGVNVDGNSAAVVLDFRATVWEKRDVYAVGKAVCGLVDLVIGNFPQNVVQALYARAADVHSRARANGFKTF